MVVLPRRCINQDILIVIHLNVWITEDMILTVTVTDQFLMPFNFLMVCLQVLRLRVVRDYVMLEKGLILVHLVKKYFLVI